MATLKNAHLVWINKNDLVAVGDIYDDARFDDGENIKTAVVLSENNGIIYTKRSQYNVEWQSQTPISWDAYIAMRGY